MGPGGWPRTKGRYPRSHRRPYDVRKLCAGNTGKNTHRIWTAIDNAYENYSQTVSTSKLNIWLTEIRDFGFAPSKGKRVLKLKYVTQTGTRPPVFTFFANHPDLVDDNYERYLTNRLRKAFDFTGTPIEIRIKKKSE